MLEAQARLLVAVSEAPRILLGDRPQPRVKMLEELIILQAAVAAGEMRQAVFRVVEETAAVVTAQEQIQQAVDK